MLYITAVVSLSSLAQACSTELRGQGAAACRRWGARTGLCLAPLHSAALPRLYGWRCRASSEGGATQSFVEWDVVVYQPPASSVKALGRICELKAQSVTIERLEEEGEGLWAVSAEIDQGVPLAAVQQVLEADYMQLVDADRVSNPHGEHAHEAFKILGPVPPGVWGTAATRS